MNVTPVKAMVFPTTIWSNTVRACDSGWRHQKVEDYSVSNLFYNGLTVDVFIINRLGNITKLVRTGNGASSGKLACVCKHSVNARTSSIGLNRNYGGLDDDSSLAYRLNRSLVEALDSNQNKYLKTPDKYGLLFEWTEEDLSKENGCYSPELDVVITINPLNAYNILHPYAESGIKAQQATASGQDYLQQLAWTCYIIDKQNSVGPRYTSIGGATFKIPVQVNGNGKDGVYVIHSKACNSDHNRTTESKFFTFEQADQLGITYVTQEAALNYKKPKPDDVTDTQIKRINLAAKVQEMFLREKQDRYKRSFDEAAVYRERFERERAFRHQQQQTQYQKSAQVRKDLMDLAKLLLLSVSTVAALVAKPKKNPT